TRLKRPYIKVPVYVKLFVPAITDEVFGLSPQMTLHVGYRSTRVIHPERGAQFIDGVECLYKFRIGKLHQVGVSRPSQRRRSQAGPLRIRKRDRLEAKLLQKRNQGTIVTDEFADRYLGKRRHTELRHS